MYYSFAYHKLNSSGMQQFMVVLNFYCRHAGARLPSVIQAPTNVHIFENASFTLHCRADHYAESLRWERDGHAITGTGSGLITIQGDGRLSSSLTVREASRKDSGVYYCLVESEAGRVDASAVVTVTGSLLTCDGECVRHTCIFLYLYIISGFAPSLRHS